MTSPTATVRPGSFSAWLEAVRPRTLPASAAPVILGFALAAAAGGAPPALGLACLAVAVSLQIAANLANDLFDARSGVDAGDRLGPRRATQSGLLTPGQVLLGLALCMLAAGGLGLYVALHTGWWLLVLGALCLLGAVAYTAGPLPLAKLGLGEVAALVFFGPVACTGTFAVLHGTVTPAAALAGLAPGMHAAAIMAVNNLRDMDSDRRAAKITLALRLGERRARILAVSALVLGNLVAAPLALITGRPALLLALLLLPAGAPLLRAMMRTPRSPALNGVLARTGQWGLVTCLVLGALLQLG